MKTALVALTLAAMLAPSFADAEALIDVTRRIHFSEPADPVAESIGHAHNAPDDPVADSLNGAHYDMPQLNSDAVNDVVLGKTRSGGTVVAVLGPVLTCSVSGTPAEFPDDLMVANAGLVMIQAGTPLAWKAAGEKGAVMLTRALAPGKSVKLENVLGAGVEAGSACTARAIGL